MYLPTQEALLFVIQHTKVRTPAAAVHWVEHYALRHTYGTIADLQAQKVRVGGHFSGRLTLAAARGNPMYTPWMQSMHTPESFVFGAKRPYHSTLVELTAQWRRDFGTQIPFFRLPVREEDDVCRLTEETCTKILAPSLEDLRCVAVLGGKATLWSRLPSYHELVHCLNQPTFLCITDVTI